MLFITDDFLLHESFPFQGIHFTTVFLIMFSKSPLNKTLFYLWLKTFWQGRPFSWNTTQDWSIGWTKLLLHILWAFIFSLGEGHILITSGSCSKFYSRIPKQAFFVAQVSRASICWFLYMPTTWNFRFFAGQKNNFKLREITFVTLDLHETKLPCFL